MYDNTGRGFQHRQGRLLRSKYLKAASPDDHVLIRVWRFGRDGSVRYDGVVDWLRETAGISARERTEYR